MGALYLLYVVDCVQSLLRVLVFKKTSKRLSVIYFQLRKPRSGCYRACQ